ncbi:MAG: biosynthetic peptidoglycan transglycosylase [Bdellovibrionales bacterium]
MFGSFIKMIISAALILFVIGAGLLLTIPDVTQIQRCMTTSMFEVYLCEKSESYVKLENISPYVIHAVISAEDGAFYSHKGFDWHEIQESVTANLKSGESKRGGSTLTQQLAKNVFLNQDKSLLRKVKEAYLAHAIETRYSKNFILEKYLNVVEFGPKLYGIKAAANHYFKKRPSELQPLEAAYLAHLLPNPKKYSSGFRKGALSSFSIRMIKIILKRMEAYGKLSPGAYETSLAYIDSFPWQNVTLSMFNEVPSYSLETDVPAPSAADLNEVEPRSDEDEFGASNVDSARETPSESEIESDVDREVNSVQEKDFE